MKFTRSGSATAVMLMIAVCAAVLSFGALATVGNIAAARVNLFGIEPPYAGYIWAATVDWFIILGFLNLEGPKWVGGLARLQIALGLGASLTFQLLHAAGIVVPIAVAATPVLAVFLSVESWALGRATARKADTASASSPRARAPVGQATRPTGPGGTNPGVGEWGVSGSVPTATPTRRPASRDRTATKPRRAGQDHRPAVAALLTENPTATWRDVQERTGLSRSRAYAALAAVKGETQDATPNGQAVEVGTA